LLAHIPGATSRAALNLRGPNLMTCSANLQRVTKADEPLEGLRLLIVEDDYFVASELASSLRLRGASIVGPAGNVRKARELLGRERPDLALLDINLNGYPDFELAAQLRAAQVGLIFTTGYDAQFLPAQFQATPCLQKPLNLPALVSLIGIALRPLPTP
jgi:DNA-binding response OmpR family regulator